MDGLRKKNSNFIDQHNLQIQYNYIDKLAQKQISLKKEHKININTTKPGRWAVAFS